jgi:hypothetical protein
MKEFFANLKIFIRMYKAGFRLSQSTPQPGDDYGFIRLYWNGKVVEDAPDFDHWTDKKSDKEIWTTMRQGHSTRL